MELNEYQKRAMQTCMESCNNFSYMFLNLVGEVGEFASKVAKAIRKNWFTIQHSHLSDYDRREQPSDFETDLRKEAGDILWQLAGLCEVMGWTLEEVAQENLDKLQSRQQRHVIDGNGDNR